MYEHICCQKDARQQSSRLPSVCPVPHPTSDPHSVKYRQRHLAHRNRLQPMKQYIISIFPKLRRMSCIAPMYRPGRTSVAGSYGTPYTRLQDLSALQRHAERTTERAPQSTKETLGRALEPWRRSKGFEATTDSSLKLNADL